MKNFLLLATHLLLSLSLFGQVELVADLNEGSEDSGVFNTSRNQDYVLRLSDKYIFHAKTEEVGQELFVLENGEVNLLVDLNNDPSDSDPQYMTKFQGAIYFAADDNTGFKIWKTDGSSAGTEIAFDLAVDDAFLSDYTIFLVNEDEMYFLFQGSAYVYDGQDLDEIPYDSEISVGSSSSGNSSSWCTYKDGIAIIDYNGSSWDLLYIHDGAVDKLSSISADNSFKNPYAMVAFDGGISFSFDATFDEDIEGRYLYLDDSNAITKQSDNAAIRSVSIKDKSSVIYSNNSEYILYDKDFPMGNQLTTGVLSLNQGSSWNRLVTDKYLAFQSAGGVFYDSIISLYNTEDGSLKTIYTGDDLTKLYSFSNYLFFFAESFNSIFDEALYRYNLESDELVSLEELTDLPNNSDLSPIGIQGEHLYFFGNYNDELGIEIYRTPADINTATKEISSELKTSFLQTSSNSLALQTKLSGVFTVEVFTSNGQLIKQQLMSNKDIIEIPYSGLVSIKTSSKNSSHSMMKFIYR